MVGVRCLVLLLSLTTTGCLLVPFPHDAYEHANVKGRVRDPITKQPVSGIPIYLAGSSTRTDTDGRFSFEAKKETNWLVVIPFAPFDPSWSCDGPVEINGRFVSNSDRRYRAMSVAANSCAYTPMAGQNRYMQNASTVDDIGTIDLIPSSPSP